MKEVLTGMSEKAVVENFSFLVTSVAENFVAVIEFEYHCLRIPVNGEARAEKEVWGLGRRW